MSKKYFEKQPQPHFIMPWSSSQQSSIKMISEILTGVFTSEIKEDIISPFTGRRRRCGGGGLFNVPGGHEKKFTGFGSIKIKNVVA